MKSSIFSRIVRVEEIPEAGSGFPFTPAWRLRFAG